MLSGKEKVGGKDRRVLLHFFLSYLKVAGAFIDSNNAKRSINPDVCRSPASTLSRSLTHKWVCLRVSTRRVSGGRHLYLPGRRGTTVATVIFHTVPWTQQLQAARPVDHTGEFIYLQVRALPHCDFVVVLVFPVVFQSKHLLRQTHRAARELARISEQLGTQLVRLNPPCVAFRDHSAQGAF